MSKQCPACDVVIERSARQWSNLIAPRSVEILHIGRKSLKVHAYSSAELTCAKMMKCFTLCVRAEELGLFKS